MFSRGKSSNSAPAKISNFHSHPVTNSRSPTDSDVLTVLVQPSTPSINFCTAVVATTLPHRHTMVLMNNKKRNLCVVLQSWLFMGQIIWLFLLTSDKQMLFSPCDAPKPTEVIPSQYYDATNSYLRTGSSEADEVSQSEEESAVDAVNEPRTVDDAFLELIGPSDPRRGIFQTKYNLVWIDVPENVTTPTGDYKGVVASFCPVSWKQQKQEPHTVPRYRNVYYTAKCRNHHLKDAEFDFKDLVKMTRRYDRLVGSGKIRHLKTSGFIFHESRTGSTLVANMLTVANPDTSRVYSEPEVLKKAMKSKNKQLVKDVLYMLQRSRSKTERRVFYKLKSDVVRHIEAMPPKVPWIFLYREPAEVIASHFYPTEHESSVVCLQGRSHPHESIVEIAKQYGHDNVTQVSNETFCALRMVRVSSLCYVCVLVVTFFSCL